MCEEKFELLLKDGWIALLLYYLFYCCFGKDTVSRLMHLFDMIADGDVNDPELQGLIRSFIVVNSKESKGEQA